jgi:hypothetical protein
MDVLLLLLLQQVLALIGVRATQHLTKRCRDTIAANTALADTFFQRWQHLFDWKRPDAGPISFPRLKPEALAGGKDPGSSSDSIDAWCERCVNECGVLLLPAGIYDHPASAAGGHFRVGLGRASFCSSLQALDAWLEKTYGAPVQ